MAILLITMIVAIMGCDNMAGEGSDPTPTATATASSTATPTATFPAKYVFLLIGDGMGLAQLNAAEIYLAQNSTGTRGVDAPVALETTKLPAQGFATTYSTNSYITDSAAAGTALACGEKTNSGVISMNEDASAEFETIAEIAKKNGMKVGIVSSVSIDHATPACFYAHNHTRGDYYNIAVQLCESGFDYFGGGGMKGSRVKNDALYYKQDDDPTITDDDLDAYAASQGFTVVKTKAAFDALTAGSGRVFAYDSVLDGDWALNYELIRNEATEISLAEYTAKGIELLDNDNGFFFMIEGGKIDWACHANDAKAAIEDTLAFDAAVKEALDFYNEHPEETLIVITGDHECGGMTIGYAETAYETYFGLLADQTLSYDAFDASLDIQAGESLSDYYTTITAAFGLNFTDDTDPLYVKAHELAQMETAFTETQAGNNYYGQETEAPVEYTLYGGYTPLTVTCTHILNKKAGIAFTSYSHTGIPVPVYAKGAGQNLFNGSYDNTDIFHKMKEAMDIE